MNRARGPTGVCLGGYVRLGQRDGWAAGAWMLQAVSIEPAQGKEKRRTRPINSAIVANQDHPGRDGTDGRNWKEDVFSGNLQKKSFLHFCGVIFGELCCIALYFHYINLELICTFVLPNNCNYSYSQYD